MDFKQYIRDIQDFPKPGILFRDITPMLANREVFHAVVDQIADNYRDQVDVVLGIESRGFLLAAAVAYALRTGLSLVRKAGKLPHRTYKAQYELEYGTDSLEIHQDAFGPSTRVLVVDDLLATGGTAVAAAELVERLGGEVAACAFLVELTSLRGRDRLVRHPVFSLVRY